MGLSIGNPDRAPTMRNRTALPPRHVLIHFIKEHSHVSRTFPSLARR